MFSSRSQRAVALTSAAVVVLFASSIVCAGDAVARPASSKRIAVVTGNHGYNAPIFERALVPRGVQVDQIKGWLDPTSYADYGVVIIDGGLKAAGVEPCEFSPEGLQRLQTYFDDGGTLLVMRQGSLTFSTDHGRKFLAQLMGDPVPVRQGSPQFRLDHPWLKHVAGPEAMAWVQPNVGNPLRATAGTGIIEVLPGMSILHQANAGKGQFIYVGWDIFRFRPEGRSKVTPAQEQTFNDQIVILEHIAADLYPTTAARLPERVFFNAPYELEPARAQTLPPAPDPAGFKSHPPTRPLPAAGNRPLGKGPMTFVDPSKGNDANDGSEAKPWKTAQFGVGRLNPGDTLVLRGGTYYEHVTIGRSGEPGKPVTIRAYPGEVAILDGGFREFFEAPATAWEPAADGAAGEFRSTKTYPDVNARAKSTNLLGRFGDSMLPLHGYRFITDLRTDNPYWNITSKVEDEGAIYCGPGLWFDDASKRIHCRLAHTTLAGLGDDNYRGETDPRKLPLVVAGGESVLTILDARHIRLQDLVIRGSRGPTMRVSVSGDVVLDGLTVYAGGTCVSAEYTQGLRAIHCAFRGIGAPWTFRGHLKYRAIEAQIFTASKWEPSGNSDFELAYCEFTDSVDGVFIGNVSDFRFHHNVLDNVTDDGIFVTAMATNSGDMPGGPLLIYQNKISRCLTAFAFGVGHGRQSVTEAGTHTGKGVWIYRNVFDFRRPVWYGLPGGADQPQELTDHGRSQGDHGSPIWEPMFVYHNTIVAHEPAWRGYYLHGWGGHAGKTVRVALNNIVAQVGGEPGTVFQEKPIALMLDGNLHYSMGLDEAGAEGFRTKLPYMAKKMLGDAPHDIDAFPTVLRNPLKPDADVHPVKQLLAGASQEQGVPFRAQHDRYGDPKFVRFVGDWREAGDYRLQKESAALNAGVSIPADWPDPLREADADAPDTGAMPVGHAGWRIGVGGRFAGSVHSR